MRTTLRIDDDLLLELKRRALSQKVSLTKLLNRVLRQGLAARPSERPRFREKTFSLGSPLVNLDKALALAATEEDEQVIRKLATRK
ncbi:MAG: antitoxin [Planctomycetes bacterium]|nr:antitoxin [Planctomycetota bacterium]